MYFRVLFYSLLLSALTAFFSCKSGQKTKQAARAQKQQTESDSGKSTHIQLKKTDPDLEQILGISSKEIKKNELYAFVQDWYGVPYKYGGCKKSGVDCSCFTNILYEQVYHKKLIGNAAEIYKSADKISIEKAKEGDLVFFKINVTYVSHVGVLLKDGHFVHASTSKGVIVSSLKEAYYKKYFHSAGQISHD